MNDEPNQNAIPLPPPPPPPPAPPGLVAMPHDMAASRVGWLTSEFVLSLAAVVLSYLLASGVFADGSLAATIIGAVVAGLAAMGYGVSRALTKGAEAKAISAASTPALRTQLKSQSSS